MKKIRRALLLLLLAVNAGAEDTVPEGPLVYAEGRLFVIKKIEPVKVGPAEILKWYRRQSRPTRERYKLPMFVYEMRTTEANPEVIGVQVIGEKP